MEKSVDKKTAGVSLVEIMISMVLVAIALVAITTVFPSMNKNRKGIHEADQAKMLATQVLEGLQYYSDETVGITAFCGDIGNGPADCNPTDDDALADFCQTFEQPQALGSAVYSIAWECNPGTDFNTAVVSVTWDKGGKPHHITVTGTLR